MTDTLVMIIGIDGSRAFAKERTGTENYSYQLLRNLIAIDTKNKDLSLRSRTLSFADAKHKNPSSNSRTLSFADAKHKNPSSNSGTLSFADAKHSYLIYLRPGQEEMVRKEDWPENFKFKVIGFPRLWTQLGMAARTFIDPLDVLFVPSHTLPLLRRPGLKTVITVHDLGAEYLPSSHQLKQVLYLNLMTHYQLSTATRIIAVSDSTKKDIQFKTKVPLSRIDVIYEGVDENLFRKLSIDIQNSTLNKYILTKKKYFLFIGTIQPRKNIERIIKAFAAFLKTSKKNDYLLVLAGGKGWKSEGIYKLPQELGIEGAVRFIGRVSNEELAILYNGATALVYPSLFEGFGLPIVEAFACGCPVITSNISSMPEVAGDAAILVDPYRIEEITEAMSDLATNESIRSSLIQKGSLMLKKFSWKKCAEETLKVIEKVGKSKK